MKRLNKEVEQFFNDHYKDHEELKTEISKWMAKTDKELDELQTKARGFEKEFEDKFVKVDKWLSKKLQDFGKKFE